MAKSDIAQKRLFRSLYPGINTRLTIPFLIIVVVIAAIGVFVVTRLVAGSLQERFNNQLLDSASAASNTIVSLEEKQLSTLRLMVFTEGVPEAIAEGNTNSLDLWLRPIAANAKLDDFIVFDSTGQGLLRLSRSDGFALDYQPTSFPVDMPLWSGVQNVLNSNNDTLGDKFLDIVHTTSDPVVYISAPVKNVDNVVVGGITVGISAKRLAEMASEQSLSSVALFSSDGRVLGSAFRAASLAILPLPAEEAASLIQRSETTSFIEELELGGVPYQVLYAPFKVRSQSVGLIAVGLPTNYIVERIGTSRDSFGLLFATLFFMVGGLGLLTARTITRPVQQLVDTTRAIRAGDLSKRVGLRTPDELGELATSFDHMTNQLVKRNKEIHTLYLQQLEQTAHREAILTSIGDAVIVQDPEGEIILRNLSAKTLLDRLQPDRIGFRDFGELRRIAATLSSPHTIELVGSFFSVLATPVCMPDGSPLGHVIVFRDVTAFVESERLKDELIMQLSHELRTPLTVVRGYTDLVKSLEAPNLSEQGSKFIQSSLDNLTVLERMINQVVDVSAILSKRFAIRKKDINLAEILENCVETWKPLAAQHELDLTLLLPSTETLIEGDANYLSQVFDHLLRNAVNYTLAGGTVEVYAAIQDDCAVIYVQDSGVGIAPDELDKVFERLYRGRSADAGPTDARGLGLGLYLSKHIVEAHHGTIHIKSKLDFGTVVTVELPVRQGKPL